MKIFAALLWLVLFMASCGSKDESAGNGSVEKAREAVKDVVTRDLKALEGARESLKQSEEKSKAALETIDKELK